MRVTRMGRNDSGPAIALFRLSVSRITWGRPRFTTRDTGQVEDGCQHRLVTNSGTPRCFSGTAF